MSDEQQQPTGDELWLNRLAVRLGMEVAQNERLVIENEILRQRLQELEDRMSQPTMNGQRHNEAAYGAMEGVHEPQPAP